MSAKNQSNKNRIHVLLPLPLAGPFDYAVPESLERPDPGTFVRVPFGSRVMTGVVWDKGENADIDDSRVKNILSLYDLPVLTAANRRLIDWVADYTLFAPGAVLKMAMSVDDVFHGVGEAFGFVKTVLPEKLKMTPARKKVLEYVTDMPETAAEIARQTGVSSGVVTGLAEAGALARQKIRPLTFAVPRIDLKSVSLSAEQQKVADRLSDMAGRGFDVCVLNGVTGSGKTEVYFDVIARALSQGKQALILLPEIGLTGQWLERFERRFGTKPAVWNSGLSQRVRRETWKAVLTGEVRVLAGARSALFLPFSELGAIIVDEEHDPSYKQEDGVVYQARDMAVVRAKLENIPIVLSSATPSLETRVNVRSGKYKEVVLPDRFGAAVLPDIRLIDMRRDPPENKGELKSFLSPVLLKEMDAVLSKGEQTLLFLNRRGYAPLVLCRKCGYRFQCPHCDAWLVEHRNGSRLECHHCGYSVPVPEACPVCGESELASCGPGVERINEEVTLRFPDARQLVVTSDLNATAAEMAELMRQIRDKEADIIIGTQILTKGHHFPSLTLVGVVDADLGLTGGDLRAGERTFQMLHQVAGRAGRAEKKGLVLLQTFDPENRIMQAMKTGSADQFLSAEAQSRELLKMPPFGRLAGIIVSGSSQAQAQQAAALLGRAAPSGNGIRVLGPAPAPMALLRGKYRYRLLLQTEKQIKIQEVMRRWLSAVSLPSSVRVQTDIDPYSFF
ncbi:MAG: primosomal protein N' [Alphaproteobacteria bacterium]|nr:primosomal protein N' [Alphaproteobacteria bacterium]